MTTESSNAEEVARLKQAIDSEDVEQVKALMTADPQLHKAPLGRNAAGPLTWVAECRIPWRPPCPQRLEMARWMMENGSDVHQGGDHPLARAALADDRIPMSELLVAHGANVNAVDDGGFRILLSPCETLAPAALGWLLDHGAEPNLQAPNQQFEGTALDYVIGTYYRSSKNLAACIERLLAAGAVTRYDWPGLLELLRGRLEQLAALLDADPSLLHRRFDGLDIGATGGRALTLDGTTLLHIAAEYCNLEAARFLLDRGADVNARATVNDAGVGGQTPLFHAVSQYYDWGLEVAELLMERGADLSIRVTIPGAYDRPDDVVECTPLGYALQFPGGPNPSGAVTALRQRNAPE